MKSLYLECFSGISGDMAVGALADLGGDTEELKRVLDSLPLEGFHAEFNTVAKNSVRAVDFCVTLDTQRNSYDHDMDYLHGGGSGEDSGHSRCDHHRNLNDCLAIVESSCASLGAKQTARSIFTILAEAEAAVHAKPVEQVHFHEIGAVDSIVDILSTAVLFDSLKVQRVYISALYEGSGFIRCRHGLIPIPAPAAAEIVKKHGLTLHLTGKEGEFVTPTGAAIAAALKTHDFMPEEFKIIKSGIGAGKRDYDMPCVLRAMLIEHSE